MLLKNGSTKNKIGQHQLVTRFFSLTFLEKKENFFYFNYFSFYFKVPVEAL